MDSDCNINPHRRHDAMRLLPAIVITAILSAACSGEKRSYVDNVGSDSPSMTTYNVETFISDSGYTRYHITTPVWEIYDEADEPYWRFPEELDLQQYDLDLKPDASMRCDSARYFSSMRLWRLDGHVVMVNTARDTFLSQQLFWDQAKRRVFTDSFIHIVRSDRTIEGYGFESNENMTAYSINRPTAIIPIDRRPGEQNAVSDSVAEADTTSVDRADRRRRAPAKISRHYIANDFEPVKVSDNKNTETGIQKKEFKKLK